MNKQKFGNVEITNVQLENLYKEVIDNSMGGNAGLAIYKIRKKGFDGAKELHSLNSDLVEMEIQTRRAMRRRITDYLNSLNDKITTPVS